MTAEQLARPAALVASAADCAEDREVAARLVMTERALQAVPGITDPGLRCTVFEDSFTHLNGAIADSRNDDVLVPARNALQILYYVVDPQVSMSAEPAVDGVSWEGEL